MDELLSRIEGKVKGRALLVGIGNPMRGDDGCGPKLIERLKGRVPDGALFDCGTAPENYIIPILDSDPGTLILADAADFGGVPGEIGVFEMTEVSRVGFSTHNSSPRLLADLFRTGKEDLVIFMVVIQPKRLGFGEGMSDEVQRSVERLVDLFVSILKAE